MSSSTLVMYARSTPVATAASAFSETLKRSSPRWIST